ncbi:hypothetical protein WME90_27945 [Sorangium sp. So ce375]|uniref:hypothetical protein n=1 Tax=Sorangium sp. So ce375 TaxID=3133306 RepID=UPI003F5C038D
MPPRVPPSPLLAWLGRRDALVRRFVLAEVLGPPRALSPRPARPEGRAAGEPRPDDAGRAPWMTSRNTSPSSSE